MLPGDNDVLGIAGVVCENTTDNVVVFVVHISVAVRFLDPLGVKRDVFGDNQREFDSFRKLLVEVPAVELVNVVADHNAGFVVYYGAIRVGYITVVCHERDSVRFLEARVHVDIFGNGIDFVEVEHMLPCIPVVVPADKALSVSSVRGMQHSQHKAVARDFKLVFLVLVDVERYREQHRVFVLGNIVICVVVPEVTLARRLALGVQVHQQNMVRKFKLGLLRSFVVNLVNGRVACKAVCFGNRARNNHRAHGTVVVHEARRDFVYVIALVAHRNRSLYVHYIDIT